MHYMARYFACFILSVAGFVGANPEKTDPGVKPYVFETLAEGLDHPWGIAVVSAREIWVTERTGGIRRIYDGQLDSQPLTGLETIFAGQGGLLDLVLHPDFATNSRVYFSYVVSDPDQLKLNTLVVARARLDKATFVDLDVIFTALPSRKTSAHYGGRMLFLPDGTLMITSGDAFNQREKAQTLDNHFGKILRLNDDGTIPADNPFVTTHGALSEIYSYGHRNMQGLVLTNAGTTIYQHEHGPKGGDELNILSPAKNYGWPAITYGVDYSGAVISPFTEKDGMEQPIKYWVPSIAPSGMVFYSGDEFPQWDGNLLISALVPGDLRRLIVSGKSVVTEEILFAHLGRLRNVATDFDGRLLLVTDGEKGQVIRVTQSTSRHLKGRVRGPS